jgi:hypothetical protein
LWPFASADIALGNDNAIVFGLLGLFVWAHITGRQRTAGILLAVAIGTKLWPAALLVLLLRERRWQALRWCAALLAVQLIAMVAWLGPESVPAAIHAIVGPALPRTYYGVTVLWTSAFRAAWSWWPTWGGYAVAVALLAVPARGYLGLGLAILAGLALNPNLWDHYLFAFALGLGLTGIGLLRDRDDALPVALLGSAARRVLRRDRDAARLPPAHVEGVARR